MEVRIKNSMLPSSISLLYNLKLKGKQSRHRSRFVKMLSERLQEVSDQERELLIQHCNLDENGEPKTIENGTKWDVKDLKAFAKDKQELYDEEQVFGSVDHQLTLKVMKQILTECDVELSGEEAYAYMYLCDAFEVE